MKHMLKEGDSGEQVKDIQHWLNVHGYNAGEEDGIFGKKTREAVIQFQSSKKIVTDGVVGSQTQVTIERMEKKGE
ncbi:peptidoglycan-binding domain-containing protein [Methanobacterium sp.]|uniref:peptidoglycan-binding domain-containing protein n=1 Tax=Methanobacterium sp. TaxID=2164 RepID=UPI003C71011A